MVLVCYDLHHYHFAEVGIMSNKESGKLCSVARCAMAAKRSGRDGAGIFVIPIGFCMIFWDARWNHCLVAFLERLESLFC